MINAILLLAAIFLAYKVYENITKFGCKCENCGKNIKCDDEFCIYCGAKNTHQEAYVDTEKTSSNNENKQSYEYNYTPPKEEKQYYNYYEVLDDLDGIIVALMAKVAKSNGVISSNEATYIAQRYNELANLTGKTQDVIDIYEEIFNREKDRVDNLEEFAHKLRDLDDAPKAYVLKILQELTDVDGDTRILDEIKEYMSFKETKTNSYYEILNSKPTDDWETIKHNYKELVKQYHYDKLSSKNLPKDLLEYAENRLKEINEAYEALKKLKN
jgi:DnaJ like chaperone protein